MSGLNLDNVQGDILEGLAKKNQTFFFFSIKANQASRFRDDLARLIPSITTTTQARAFHDAIKKAKNENSRELIKNHGVNIAFSHKGLLALGIEDDLGDAVFKNGMFADIKNLGDDLAEWVENFKKDIHGVILVTANSEDDLGEALHNVKRKFSVGHKLATIEEVTRLSGDTRLAGREHFGFKDGVSQPVVEGVGAATVKGETPVKVETPIRQGVILLGREGDIKRPDWAQDGSFLAFRYLEQLVPEFDAFLEASASKMGLPQTTGAELLGARLVGRWKSGVPIVLAPKEDNPTATISNDFNFNSQDQVNCPFAAHIRKSNPRSDVDDGVKEIHRIIRRGIPFGPEVSPNEISDKKTAKDSERGLLFACYQSNLRNGFQFIQAAWANNPEFPFMKPITPGIDPIIGVAQHGMIRQMVGANPKKPDETLILDQKWVIPRGGEYFFSPSLSALKSKFGTAGSAAEQSGHQVHSSTLS
ncbi:Dyp-type peroxidase [Xylaria longipes]|nr:Dyp-type peroxidase [Xylaria longipes]